MMPGMTTPTIDAADIVHRYWAAANARDWDAFGALLAPDMVYEIPQTRERVQGRAAYLRFNVEYPGDWQAVPHRIVGTGSSAASWTRFTVGDSEAPGLCFFDLDEAGLITRVTDFWPEPYEPPPGRGHLVQRY